MESEKRVTEEEATTAKTTVDTAKAEEKIEETKGNPSEVYNGCKRVEEVAVVPVAKKVKLKDGMTQTDRYERNHAIGHVDSEEEESGDAIVPTVHVQLL